MKFDDYFKLKDMTLNITNGCNLKCVYCFEHDKDGRKMSVENAICIVEKCYQNYLKNRSEEDNNFMVSFFGGAPFLNFEVMEEVMKYSKEKGYSIDFGVTTNLTILTDHIQNEQR